MHRWLKDVRNCAGATKNGFIVEETAKSQMNY